MEEDIFCDQVTQQLYNSLVYTSENDPYDDAVRFLEFVRASKNVIVQFWCYYFSSVK